MGRKRKEDRKSPLARLPGALSATERETYREYDFEAHFKAVRDGSRDDPDEVLHWFLYFCNEVTARRYPPMWLLEHLRDVHEQLMAGVPQRVVMPLPSAPEFSREELLGRDAIRSFDLAKHVFNLCVTHPVVPLQKAKYLVADLDNSTFKTVDRAWLANVGSLWITNPNEHLTKSK